MKIFKTLGFAALAVIAVPAITSCKDDEPNGANDADKAIVDFDGERLTNIGSYNFEYDKEGRLVEIYGSSVELEIDYSKGKIEADDEEGTIKFNGKGYVSELSASWEEYEESYGEVYQYKGSGTMKYSYDSNGHLTSISASSKETGKYDGETSTWETNYTTTLKWNNGNLTRATLSGWEKEDGEKYNFTEDYTISYDNEVNTFKQIPVSLSNYIYADDGLNLLASVGLFGKGPENFPTGYEEHDIYDDDDYDYNYTLSMSFILNDNGSIRQERSDYFTYGYGYTSYSTRSEFFQTDSQKKINLRKMFVKKHNNK